MFGNGYSIYYCHGNKVIEISKENQDPIWYFPNEDQL